MLRQYLQTNYATKKDQDLKKDKDAEFLECQQTLPVNVRGREPSQ
jgi:hypothetical protein